MKVLPDPIRAYFDADNANECDAAILAFAPDAVVTDEGQAHAGHEAIAAWWRAAKTRYQHAAEPLETEQDDGVTRVRARVTGRFAGSPATLTYSFRLAGDRIESLEIGA